MSHEAHVIEQYDDTPFTAWFDHFAAGHIHLGYWPPGHEDQTFADAAAALIVLLIDRLGVGEGQRVLDVGCGVLAGPAIQLATTSGCQVDGVTLEPSAERLVAQRAAEAGVADDVRAHVGNANALPFPDDSFDAAWLIEMLIHVPDKEPVLREVHRVLRPGAHIVIADYPAGEAFTPDLRWVTDNFFVPVSAAELTRILDDAGFTAVTWEDHNATVAIPSFQRMLDDVLARPDQTKAVVGEDTHALFVDLVPDGVAAHRDRALSYGVFTARAS